MRTTRSQTAESETPRTNVGPASPGRRRLRSGHALIRLPAAALLLGTALAHADPPPDAVWQAMKERNVVVEREDGTSVSGKLIGVDSTTAVILTKTGEPVTVPKDKVKSLRGEVAEAPAPTSPATATTAPATAATAAPSAAPSASAAAAPPGEGAVTVHIDATGAEVKLYRITHLTEFIVAGRVGAAAEFEPVCIAPCDKAVDGSKGDTFFLTADRMRIGPEFQIADKDHTGKVTLVADVATPPSRGLLWGGLGVLGAGVGVAVGGITGAFLQATDDERPPFFAITAVGGVAVVASIIMMARATGDYHLKLPESQKNVAGLRFRSAGFTPPVQTGTTTLPAMGSLSFSF